MVDASLQVVLQRCHLYDRSTISERIDTMLSELNTIGSLHGKTVLLKPNLISSSGPSHSCTHSDFISGVAAWFLEQGARVIIGDSPAFGNTVTVCRKQGITEALKGLDVRLMNFSTPVEKLLACGVKVTVAREVFECDLFVGLPKVKAHNQMFVTLAVKNIFGIVKGINKGMLHMVHGNSHSRFAEIILDLVSLLPPQLHLADGIEAMHISGPLDGSSLTLGCIAAGRNPVALDTAILDLLELDCNNSPLWQAASLRKLVESEIGRLTFPQLTPIDFHGSGFMAPGSLNPIRFNPFRFLSGMAKRILLAGEN